MGVEAWLWMEEGDPVNLVGATAQGVALRAGLGQLTDLVFS